MLGRTEGDTFPFHDARRCGMNARLLALPLWLTLSLIFALLLPSPRALLEGPPHSRPILLLWRSFPVWLGVVSAVLAATESPDATVPPGNELIGVVRVMLPLSSLLVLV
jgi:hypothetical protein